MDPNQSYYYFADRDVKPRVDTEFIKKLNRMLLAGKSYEKSKCIFSSYAFSLKSGFSRFLQGSGIDAIRHEFGFLHLPYLLSLIFREAHSMCSIFDWRRTRKPAKYAKFIVSE